jgi:hypothetical protein
MINYNDITIRLSEGIVNSIFDECEKYDSDETGGRLIGVYSSVHKKLEIQVNGEIGPGPKAKRSMTSFFQDGESQEEIFRKIELEHPNIEHLGNWHTHHVNGYSTLSQGDVETYHRIVNHEKYTSLFFYALLVTAKNYAVSEPLNRYNMKHFLFFRNHPDYYEIPNRSIEISDYPAYCLGGQVIHEGTQDQKQSLSSSLNSNILDVRYYDKITIETIYPSIKPYFVKNIESLVWKGTITLINGLEVKLMILEDSQDGHRRYSVTVQGLKKQEYKSLKKYHNLRFNTASAAIILIEKELNRQIFQDFSQQVL